MASQNNNGSQQSSTVGIGNEGFSTGKSPSIPKPPPKKDNESSKTSKESKDDKKQ